MQRPRHRSAGRRWRTSERRADRASSTARRDCGDLPHIQRGQTDVIHIKDEGTSINYGLRDSADVFNDRIQGIRGA
jgi:hypothetical protein